MKPSKSAMWPIVAMVAVGCAFVFGIYFVSAPQDRSALLALVSPVISAILAAFVSSRLKQTEKKIEQSDAKIDAVVTQTNGNQARLLDQHQQLINRVGPTDEDER